MLDVLQLNFDMIFHIWSLSNIFQDFTISDSQVVTQHRLLFSCPLGLHGHGMKHFPFIERQGKKRVMGLSDQRLLQKKVSKMMIVNCMQLIPLYSSLTGLPPFR